MVGRSTPQERELAVEALCELRRREQPDPASGELDGERDAVDGPADRRDGAELLLQRVPGRGTLGRLEEQGDADVE